MSNKPSNNIDIDAAHWFVALNSEENLSDKQFDEFAQWVDNPEAADALDRTEVVWNLASMLDECETIERYREEYKYSWRQNWRNKRTIFSSLLLVACICLVSFFGYFKNMDVTMQKNRYVVYQTTTGERKTIRLNDNSIVTLNTASEIHVDYGLLYRNVILERGEALFEVKSDKNRPFKVFAGSGEITALGTVFDVRFYDNDEKKVDVSLLEGKLSVEKTYLNKYSQDNTLPKKLLSSGERIAFSDLGMSTVATISDIDQVASWKNGNLNFTNIALSDIVKEVNRYSVSKLIIDDPVLENERMSAYFNLNNGHESLLIALEANLNIKWYKSSGVTVLYRNIKRNDYKSLKKVVVSD